MRRREILEQTGFVPKGLKDLLRQAYGERGIPVPIVHPNNPPTHQEPHPTPQVLFKK